MGTCIGKRNIRYFILFLFQTSIHAMIGAILCVCHIVFIDYPKFMESTGAVFGKKAHGHGHEAEAHESHPEPQEEVVKPTQM